MSVGSTDAEFAEAVALCRRHDPDCDASWFASEQLQPVVLNPYLLDREEVSVADFADFAAKHDYRTTAEKRGYSYHRFVKVPGFSWRNPIGEGAPADDHFPVVHVSWNDAVAYCEAAGGRLPTEAEWEFAARGGLEQATYAWGDDVEPAGKSMANFWKTDKRPFPVVSPKAGGAVGTSPVETFPANGYGLYDMTGNAWQWVADWYRSDYFRMLSYSKLVVNPVGPSESYDPEDRGAPANAPKRVTRGGSFLCNVDYCLSYRPSARRGTDPYNPMSHLGFRLVMTQQEWERSKTKPAGR